MDVNLQRSRGTHFPTLKIIILGLPNNAEENHLSQSNQEKATKTQIKESNVGKNQFCCMGSQEVLRRRNQSYREKQKKDIGTVYLTRENWKKNNLWSCQRNNHEGAEKIKDSGKEGVLATSSQLLHKEGET